MDRRGSHAVLSGLAVGACIGSLSFVLVTRLNPEVGFAPGGAAVGAVMWVTWGAVAAGLPLALVLWVTRWIRGGSRRDGEWSVPVLTAVAYLLAGILSRVNADLHPEYLSGSGHRVLAQDAVGWLIGALLALLAGSLVRRMGGSRRLRIAFVVVFAVLPMVRLSGQPTPHQSPARDVPRPLGSPTANLLVIAVEGLDSDLLIAGTNPTATPTLRGLVETGSWGPLDAFEPYLRWSLWTTLATGVEPGLHGVKAHRAWRLPAVYDGPLRLLPWTPQGSRLILPWWAATMVRPPTAGVPPLWARLRASGVETRVLGWPGVWLSSDAPERDDASEPEVQVGSEIVAAIDQGLADFPDQRTAVVTAIRRDGATVANAVDDLERGAGDMWLHLGAVAAMREHLEPLRPTHTRERRLRDLSLELLDTQVRELITAAPEGRLVVMVSPYGMQPPDLWERWRRLLGSGDDWRTSALGCPDGVLLMVGDNVRAAHRFPYASITDVAPTVCYLLGLPIVQSMDGRVILDAVQPAWVDDHPLRVVD
jgi:hypothetical protein